MANPVPVTYNAAASPIAGGRFLVSEFWRNLAPGWTEITVSGQKPPGGIVAYSGAAVDSRGGRLFLFGGGHFDYWGNEVWHINLESREYVRHYVPDFDGMNMSYSGSVETDAAYQHALTLVDSNYPGALNFPGGVKRPISRHTYSSVHWVDATQRLVAGGSSTWSGYNERYWQTSAEVWTSVPQDCWTYDPNQGDEGWQWMGSKLVNPAYDTKGVISTYHRMRERLYQPSANLNNNIEMREWNPHTNTFTLLPGSLVGVTVTGYLACADTKRDRVLVLSYYTPDPVRLWSWAPDTGEWTLLSSGQFASFEACVYDEAADAMLIMNGTTLYKYDCVTGTVTSSEAPLPNLLQIGGRFMYDYRRKVSLAIYNDAQTGLRLFAFKGQQ